MDNKQIGNLIEVLMILKRDYKELTVSQAATFLMLGNDEDMFISDISRKLGVTDATVSRTLDRLSNGRTGTLKQKGLGYVKISRGKHDDDRRISISLTKKGLQVKEEILEVLDRLS